MDEIVFVKFWFCQTYLTCDPALFPHKNIPNIAKSNRIFLRNGRGDKEFIWDIWITQWVKSLRLTAYFSILAIIRRKRGVKVSPNVLTLGPSRFDKYSSPSKHFRTVFLLGRVLPLVRISAILDHTGGVKTKDLQQGIFRGCWIDTQNFGNV